MKRSLLKTCSIIAGATIIFSSLSISRNPLEVQAASMRSASEIVQEMGVGWNLGNTLDAKITNLSYNTSPISFETGWGNPVTTKAMIDKIKNAGFKTIRIPTTWGEHLDGNNKLNEEWVKRVKEVVDYCIADDLYVILNTHHEGNWVIPTYAKESSVTPKLKTLWTQIAEAFKDYDDHLIFETLNEPRLEGTPYEWTGGTSESRDVVNKYNAAALESIRKTGGNNLSRAVMMPTYAASGSSTTMNDFKVPDDKNVIASVHAYSPYFFAMDTSSNSVNTWGSSYDKYSLDVELDSYLNTFKSKGVPVVIGEFGSINKNNTSSRAELAEYYVTAAQKRGIPCVWWDNNYAETNKGETFGLLNRSTLNWYFSDIKDALIRGYKNVHPEATEDDKPSTDVTNPDSGNTKPDSGNTNPGTETTTPTDNEKISITSKINDWGGAYQADFTLKNNTSSDINNWSFKIKKNDIVFTNYWDVKITEENGYYVVTPQAWKTTILANSSIVISIQGTGKVISNFEYKFD